MSAREFLEWCAYIERHPPTNEVVDWQLAVLLSLFYSVNRPTNSAAIPPEQWSMLEQRRVKTTEELAAEESRRIKNLFGVM